jgi:hypothetical protein
MKTPVVQNLVRPKSSRQVLIPATLAAVLTLLGCQSINKNELSSEDLEQVSSLKSIQDYLSANLGDTGFGGKAYCAYDVIDTEAAEETKEIYLWVVCQEYYSENQTLKQGTGSSFPLALTVRSENSENGAFQGISHRKPRDGALYAEDMPVIFPEKTIAKIQSESTRDHNNRVQTLQDEIRQLAGLR